MCKSSILFISSKRVKLVPRVLLAYHTVTVSVLTGRGKKKSLLISEFGAFQPTPETTAILWVKWVGEN